jgi:hypothetical protein
VAAWCPGQLDRAGNKKIATSASCNALDAKFCDMKTQRKKPANAKPTTKGQSRTVKAHQSAARPKSRAKGAVALLSGGNPQIPKADGDAPVQAYIAALQGWKRAVGKRLDALIVQNVPEVHKAVK